MKNIVKQIRYIFFTGCFALLCVFRFWDRKMHEHSIWISFLHNYHVMILITAVYVMTLILFGVWVLAYAKKEEQRVYEYFLTLLYMVSFPAFLSDKYFGCADIVGIIAFVGCFVILFYRRMSKYYLVILFTLMQIPFMKDVCVDLSAKKFAFTLVFYMITIGYFWAKNKKEIIVWMGLPGGVIWWCLGDYNRGLFYLMTGAIYGCFYSLLLKENQGDDGSVEEAKESYFVAVGLLICVAMFVTFWMYGKPLLMKEKILEY